MSRKKNINHRNLFSRTFTKRKEHSTLPRNKPTYSREKPKPSQFSHGKKNFKFRENQFSPMKRKPQPAQNNKLNFFERRKNLTGDFNKGAQPRKSGHAPQIEAAFSRTPVPWPSHASRDCLTKKHGCFDLDQATEGLKKRTNLIAWSSGYICTTSDLREPKKRPTLPKKQPQGYSRTSHKRETWLVPPFSLPHSNLSITSPVRPSLSHCWLTIAFRWCVSDDYCCWHAARRAFCSRFRQWVSYQLNLAYDNMNSLVFPILRLRHRNHWRWPDVCLVLSLDLHDSTWDLLSTVCHHPKKNSTLLKKTTPGREKKCTQEQIKTQLSLKRREIDSLRFFFFEKKKLPFEREKELSTFPREEKTKLSREKKLDIPSRKHWTENELCLQKIFKKKTQPSLALQIKHLSHEKKTQLSQMQSKNLNRLKRRETQPSLKKLTQEHLKSLQKRTTQFSYEKNTRFSQTQEKLQTLSWKNQHSQKKLNFLQAKAKLSQRKSSTLSTKRPTLSSKELNSLKQK